MMINNWGIGEMLEDHTIHEFLSLSHIYIGPFFSSTMVGLTDPQDPQQFWDAERKKKPEAVQQEQLLASQPRAVGSDIGPEAVSDWIIFLWISSGSENLYRKIIHVTLNCKFLSLGLRYSFCVFLKDKRYTLPRWSMGSGKC